MARVFVNDTTLTAIADAIREKNGSEDTYKPSQMADAVRGIQSGGGVDLFQNATSLANVFKDSEFDEGAEISLNLHNINGSMSGAFYGALGLKKIKLKGNVAKNVLGVSSAFRAKSVTEATLEEVDMSEFNAIFDTLTAVFADNTKLKIIKGELDFTNANGTIPFNKCSALEEIRVKPESIRISLSLNSSPLLSDESIHSIVDGLADLTGQTAQTLTLHATVKAKLTEAQISQITSKNWTLA